MAAGIFSNAPSRMKKEEEGRASLSSAPPCNIQFVHPWCQKTTASTLRCIENTKHYYILPSNFPLTMNFLPFLAKESIVDCWADLTHFLLQLCCFRVLCVKKFRSYLNCKDDDLVLEEDLRRLLTLYDDWCLAIVATGIYVPYCNLFIAMK